MRVKPLLDLGGIMQDRLGVVRGLRGGSVVAHDGIVPGAQTGGIVPEGFHPDGCPADLVGKTLFVVCGNIVPMTVQLKGSKTFAGIPHCVVSAGF